MKRFKLHKDGTISLRLRGEQLSLYLTLALSRAINRVAMAKSSPSKKYWQEDVDALRSLEKEIDELLPRLRKRYR